MPHQIAGRRLGRSGAHRMHMLANLAVAVLRYEKVHTTEAKAKEVRGMVDKMIVLGKRGDLAGGMHPGIGAPGKVDSHPLAGQSVKRLLQLPLHGPRVGLDL